MEKTSDSAAYEQRVLIFPAQTPKVSDKQIYFLFSLRQMEDIVMESTVLPVPLSPPHVEGITEWREQIVPVVSLEMCLGLKTQSVPNIQRLMVVRTTQKNGSLMGDYRVMFRVVPPIRMVSLPFECTPVSGGWIPERYLAKGVYEWENGYLVVAHMENILFEGN